jgi:hypothetical protein
MDLLRSRNTSCPRLLRKRSNRTFILFHACYFAFRLVGNMEFFQELDTTGINMPQYFNPKTEAFQVRVTPYPFWRQILRSYTYFVGDRVMFKIDMIGSEKTVFCLFESIGGKPIIRQRFVFDWLKRRIQSLVSGRVIDVEGDISYKIGTSEDPDEAETIFTARVLHKDSLLFQWFWLFVGVILTFITAILTGFIDIQKAWRIWMP